MKAEVEVCWTLERFIYHLISFLAFSQTPASVSGGKWESLEQEDITLLSLEPFDVSAPVVILDIISSSPSNRHEKKDAALKITDHRVFLEKMVYVHLCVFA